jgi:hypothetical protein
MKIKLEVEIDTASEEDVEVIEKLVELIEKFKIQINTG